MIRSTIRQMMALALVPEQYVESLFADLSQELTDAEHPALPAFLTYFNGQWMQKTSMWNVFGISDRTNNYSEGMLMLPETSSPQGKNFFSRV